MKNTFSFQIQSFTNLKEIPGSFKTSDYLAMLEDLEVDVEPEFNEDDIHDIFIMALQDLKPAVAAYKVLKYSLGDRLKDGQLHNIASEMLEDKLWEEYADLSLHESFFNIGSLLYAAFPQNFPKPDAVKLNLKLTASVPLAKHPLDETFLVRALAAGMDEDTILHRLFEAQLKDTKFPEADKILWTFVSTPIDDKSADIEIVSSGYWLDPLQGVKAFESQAESDHW